MRSLSIDWSKCELSRDLVLMGHSFGGVSVLAAAGNCPHAVAVIALDPWFHPRVGEDIGAGAKAKILIIWSHNFDIAGTKSEPSFDGNSEL